MDYRKKEDFSIIRIPESFTPEDRGKRECCCSFDVIADLTSTDSWHNDITGVFAKKAKQSDSITWTITKCGTVGALTNLGTAGVYPNEPLGVGFMFDWKQYLSTYGVGEYTISIAYTIAGVTRGFAIGKYELNHYNIGRLDGTIRIKSEFNSYSLSENFDFTNSNHVDTIRTQGMFGLRKPGTVIANHVDINRKVLKSTRENLNKYDLFCEPVKECSSIRLLDFHFLNEDRCYLTDHNAGNHSYRYLDIPVYIESVEEPEYHGQSRLATIKATFGDRKKDQKSYYNV